MILYPGSEVLITKGPAGKARLCAPALLGALLATALVSPCVAESVAPLTCDQQAIASALASLPDTTVVQVKALPEGFAFTAQDWHVGPLRPGDVAGPDGFLQVKLAADLCLVKLLVGPGYTIGVTPTDPQYSAGIGIEVWLPTPANWNKRIRNYGGGGWVGGAHTLRVPDVIDPADPNPSKANIGSKSPAPVIAGMGYAVGTTDAGQPLYQNGSFTLLKDGSTINSVLMRDFSVRAFYELAVKTKALVKAYYGQESQYAYFDGQSQGGRQALKIAQEFPELYDGYLAAAPAIAQEVFGLSKAYAQLVMKEDLGYTALAADGVNIDPNALALRDKVRAATTRAVFQCDSQNGSLGFGFLLDPNRCGYNPATDAAALCAGQTNTGVTPNVAGTGTPATYCLTLAEAQAINKIWYGETTDGSFDANQTVAGRIGKSLGPNQVWWGFARGVRVSDEVAAPQGTDYLALARNDVRYSAAPPFTLWATNPPDPTDFINPGIPERNKWTEIGYADLVLAIQRISTSLQPALGHLLTYDSDLSQARAHQRKIIVYLGMADESIPYQGTVHYYERVASRMGGFAKTQKFFRLYLVPGMRHSSQGWAYTVSPTLAPATLASSGNGFSRNVPLPKLPGAENQTPTEDLDQLFTALKHWVEDGTRPEDILITSRDGTVSYPICVYPKMTVYKGGPKTSPGSYACSTGGSDQDVDGNEDEGGE